MGVDTMAIVLSKRGQGTNALEGNTMNRSTRLTIQSICGLTLVAMPFAIYAALASGSLLLIAACAIMAMGAAILAIAADA